jgi:ABC-type branched-subunit amino acid transport system ATPase component/MFS family permease
VTDVLDAPRGVANVAVGRPAVPSDRQRAMGVGDGATRDGGASNGAAAWAGTAQERPLARDRLRLYADQLNPWSIARGYSVTPLLVVGLLSLLGNADYRAVFVLIPQMQPSFGYDLQFLVVFNYFLQVAQTLGAPLMGHLADRVRRVWLLRGGGIVLHLGSIVMGLSTGPGALLAGRAIATAGQTVSQPAAMPLLTDAYPPERRARSFGFVMQAGSLGGVITPIVIGVIAAGYGWRTAFIVLGTSSLLLTMLYFTVREPVRGEQDRLAMGAGAEAAQHEQESPSWKESWRALGSVRSLRRIWVAMPFLSAASFIFVLLPIYFASVWHLDATAYGLVAAAEAATTLVGQTIVSVVTDRMLAERPARVMALIGGICVVLMFALLAVVLAPALWVAILAACVATTCSLLVNPGFSPPLIAVMSLVTPARMRGMGLQTYAPWMLLSFPILFYGVGAIQTAGWSPRMQLLPYLPLFLVAAVILATGGLHVAGDMRSALAASMADEEARRAHAEGRRKLVVCRDVDVVHDGARVLFGVDLDVVDGEILALLGTNGAGKSTLLRAIAGVQEPSSGAILYDGADITHTPPHLTAARGVALVPGGRAVFPRLSVAENLRVAAESIADAGERTSRVEEMLELFPVIRERMPQQAGNLSGGEQQMLALSQAFLRRPRLLLVDELSLGLAPMVVEQLLDVLRRIHASGTTIVLVEQSVNVALTIAQRAVFMEKGRVVFEGDAADVLQRGDLARSVFLGQSRAASSGSLGGMRAAAAARSDGWGDDAEREELLRVDGLSVRFGGVSAVDDVSIRVGRGEIVGVIGPNGAGKSTLFDAVSGFVTPSAGTVHAFGEDVTALSPEARAQRGLVRSFQNLQLFAAMTVREVIALALQRSTNRPASRRIDNLLDGLGLRGCAEQFVAELSTGTRRIVDLACLLATEPRLLLLDEPSSGLAQSETEELGPLIGRIAKETGCSILVIEHDLPLVSAVATRMLAMDQGRVIADGTPREVMDDPAVARAYLGASEAVVKRSGLLAATAQHTPASRRNQ